MRLHSHFTEAVSILPQFMFMGNRDVSPNIPLDNKKNYPKYSQVTLSGVLANGVKTFLVLGKFHLVWVSSNTSPDLDKG